LSPLRFKKVLLSLGSNLGKDKKANLLRALGLLEDRKTFLVEEVSGFYASPPWGYESKNYFVNAVVRGKTVLSPWELLLALKNLELKMGRRPSLNRTRYQDRVIDIDIVFYEDQVINTKSLTLPHPLAHKRGFVIIPALDVAENWVHPVFKKTVSKIYEEKREFFDKQGVKRI